MQSNSPLQILFPGLDSDLEVEICEAMLGLCNFQLRINTLQPT